MDGVMLHMVDPTLLAGLGQLAGKEVAGQKAKRLIYINASTYTSVTCARSFS